MKETEESLEASGTAMEQTADLSSDRPFKEEVETFHHNGASLQTQAKAAGDNHQPQEDGDSHQPQEDGDNHQPQAKVAGVHLQEDSKAAGEDGEPHQEDNKEDGEELLQEDNGEPEAKEAGATRVNGNCFELVELVV